MKADSATLMLPMVRVAVSEPAKMESVVNALLVIVAMAVIIGPPAITRVAFVKSVLVQAPLLYIKPPAKTNGISVPTVLLILACPIIAEEVQLPADIALVKSAGPQQEFVI